MFECANDIITQQARTREDRAAGLKLPDDFLGTVAAFLRTPPPPKKARKQAKRKSTRKKER